VVGRPLILLHYYSLTLGSTQCSRPSYSRSSTSSITNTSYEDSAQIDGCMTRSASGRLAKLVDYLA